VSEVHDITALNAFKRVIEAVIPYLPDTDAPEGFMDDCETIFKALGGKK
jgi:hypothetical protein